jgi:bacterioferritin
VFDDLILEEEAHQDQFDTEIDNMSNFGEKYLTLQAIEHSKKASVGTLTT